MPRISVCTRKGLDRFRRAGFKFGQEPRVMEVSSEQLAILRKEKMLVVKDASKKELPAEPEPVVEDAGESEEAPRARSAARPKK